MWRVRSRVTSETFSVFTLTAHPTYNTSNTEQACAHRTSLMNRQQIPLKNVLLLTKQYSPTVMALQQCTAHAQHAACCSECAVVLMLGSDDTKVSPSTHGAAIQLACPAAWKLMSAVLSIEPLEAAIHPAPLFGPLTPIPII